MPFFSVSASEFVELFVGMGAARVRDTFDQAKKRAPAIVFVDELDAIGRRRGSGIGGSHDEREQTLNQMLVSLDGFERNDHIVVMAATNLPDVLDKALLRPGRFDQRLEIGVPDRDARLEALKIHTRNKPLADDVCLETIADKTPALTGADLENLANEAALHAVRERDRDKDETPRISMDRLERSLLEATSRKGVFTKLDSLLVESAAQVARPTGKIVARLTLWDDTVVEGKPVWADSRFIKVRCGESEEEVILNKCQVRRVEALAGTDVADDVTVDQWATQRVDVL